MEYAYHFQVQHVIAAQGGQPEKRFELRSEYYLRTDAAINHLNSALTNLQSSEGQYFTALPIASIEIALATEHEYHNMVFLQDRTHKMLSITRVPVR